MLQVLLVDDEPFILQGLAMLIDWEKEGFTLAGTAANGLEAIAFLEKTQVDLIIADIKMPAMTGIELLEKIRAEHISDAYFIILSGYSDFGFAQRAIELGVTRYLTKPTKRRELLGVLEEIEGKLSEKQKGGEEKKEVSNLMVQKAMDYIALNYSEKISLKNIAEELYLSPNYLSELFKRHTDKNISEYITQFRLDKARRYLQQPEYKIADVSDLVGFGDPRYFSSMFKRQYGMTPNEYRNRSVK